MDRGPLALADVDQFVEQDGVFSVQVDVLLYNIQSNKLALYVISFEGGCWPMANL